MIFDETTPRLSQFQKPIFGRNTLFRNADGTRTGLSRAVSGGLSWLSGLTPFGSQAGMALDNLIQNDNNLPSYLTDQQWYQNNVSQSRARSGRLALGLGGAADTVRGLAMQAVSAGLIGGAPAGTPSAGSVGGASAQRGTAGHYTATANPIRTNDPSISFRQLLSQQSLGVTPPISMRRPFGALPDIDPILENVPGASTPPTTYGLKLFARGGMSIKTRMKHAAKGKC